MIRSLWSAATGMQGQQLKLDVIANNLANVNTAGFKRGRANFQDLMYQNPKSFLYKEYLVLKSIGNPQK